MSDRPVLPVPSQSQNIIFSGRVQGVGFRFTAQRFAVDLGLAGWVQNRPTGDVEMQVQGAPEHISELRRRLEVHFTVRAVQVRDVPVSDEHTSFDVRY